MNADAVQLAVILGVAVYVLAWLLGWLDHVAPPAHGTEPAAATLKRPVVGKIQPPDTDELEQQQQRRASIRERVQPAVRTIASQDSDAEALGAALGTLHGVVNENERDGSLGMIASTELCNLLIADDALKRLDALRGHADPQIAARSEAVFQHVVPRIWNF